jgi:hypothetical protein
LKNNVLIGAILAMVFYIFVMMLRETFGFWISLSLAVALVSYGILIDGLLNSGVKQSFATWMLWTALDVIAMASTFFKDGNAALLIIYCSAGAFISTLLLVKKQFYWSAFEWIVTGLVLLCLVVWGMSGHTMATIVSTLALGIASVPQFRDAWRAPESSPPKIWVGFTLANLLSFIGGAGWTIEDRFYYGFCTILCLALVVLGKRKVTIAQPVQATA